MTTLPNFTADKRIAHAKALRWARKQLWSGTFPSAAARTKAILHMASFYSRYVSK